MREREREREGERKGQRNEIKMYAEVGRDGSSEDKII